MSAKTRPCDPDVAITLSMPDWLGVSGLGRTAAYALLVAGEVDSILIGDRRYVIRQSYTDYVDRQRRGVERDPAERAAAAERYRVTSHQGGGHHAAAARRGKPPPKVPRRPVADEKGAMARRTASANPEKPTRPALRRRKVSQSNAAL